jgi:ribulose-phosphate 3-epimerase
VRKAGASPGIALNPATPLTKLDYVLDRVDRVLVMTVEPGFSGQRLIPTASQRIRILRENLAYRELKACIEVDGNIDIENAAALARDGARILVLGTSSIFRGNGPLDEALLNFKIEVNRRLQLV